MGVGLEVEARGVEVGRVEEEEEVEQRTAGEAEREAGNGESANTAVPMEAENGEA